MGAKHGMQSQAPGVHLSRHPLAGQLQTAWESKAGKAKPWEEPSVLGALDIGSLYKRNLQRFSHVRKKRALSSQI